MDVYQFVVYRIVSYRIVVVAVVVVVVVVIAFPLVWIVLKVKKFVHAFTLPYLFFFYFIKQHIQGSNIVIDIDEGPSPI